MENKKKGSSYRGRPTKGKDKLSTSISLKLTEEDYKSVKKNVEGLRLTPTQYAREMTLKGQIKNRFSLEELDLMRKLLGVANNMNQVTCRTYYYVLCLKISINKNYKSYNF